MCERVYDINPIQTLYKKVNFRSRLEAYWAVFFDLLKVKWEYEPDNFRISELKCGYCPDFYLEEYEIYIEIKPTEPTKTEVIKLESVRNQTKKKCIFQVGFSLGNEQLSVIWGDNEEVANRAYDKAMLYSFTMSKKFLDGLKRLGFTYEEFIDNWKYCGGDFDGHLIVYRALYPEWNICPHSSYCICGHFLKNNCFVTDGESFLIIGSCCINRFLPRLKCSICKCHLKNSTYSECDSCREFNRCPCGKSIEKIYKKCYSCNLPRPKTFITQTFYG